MMEMLGHLGVWFIGGVWIPVAAWTAISAAVLVAVRAVPDSYLRIHRDVRVALILALPAGLLLGLVVPAVQMGTGPAGPLASQLLAATQPAGSAAAAAPVAVDPLPLVAVAGLLSLLFALAGIVALVRLLAAASDLRRILSRARPYRGPLPAGGVPQSVRVLVSEEIEVPFSSGVIRKCIAMPDDRREGCATAVLHELTHHQERDVERILVTRVVSAAFAAHPLVRILAARIDVLLEMICDQSVMERAALSKTAYANLLLSYVPAASAARREFSVPIGRSRSELTNRISAMSSIPRGTTRQSFILGAALLVAISSAVACSQADLDADADAAQETYVVSGKITDPNTKLPLAGANVQVSGTEIGSATGPDGTYTLGPLESGTYELRMTFADRPVRTETVRVPGPNGGDGPTSRRLLQMAVENDGTVMIDERRLQEEEVRVLLKSASDSAMIALEVYPGTPTGAVMDLQKMIREGAPDSVLIRYSSPGQENPDAPFVPFVLDRQLAPRTSGEEQEFVVVEEMPELEGGLASLMRDIKYPSIAKKAGVEGRVIVEFTVGVDGRPSNPAVIQGIGAGCDEEAVRAVMASHFTPGRQRGIPVKVRMTLPITFSLGA